MPTLSTSSEEILRRGEQLYQQHIRPLVEPHYRGQFLVLHVETGNYEIGADKMVAYERAHTRYPDDAFYFVRIGYPAAVKLGGK